MVRSDSPPGEALAGHVRAWSRYWQSGASHSCSTASGTAYGGAVARLWHDVFGQMAPGARVLDIACGNASLALTLVEARPAADWHYLGIDAAEAPVPWLASSSPAVREHVQVERGIDAAALPLAAGQYDRVVSQYGIEYAELEPAVREALRVCHPEGQVHLMVHLSEGRPATLGRVEVEHIAWLDMSGWAAASAAMVPWMARSRDPAQRAALASLPAAGAARAAYDHWLEAVRKRVAQQEDGADILTDVCNGTAQAYAVAASGDEAAALERLLSIRAALDDQRDRLTQLDRATCDQARLATIQDVAARTGRRVGMHRLFDGPHLMGMHIVMT